MTTRNYDFIITVEDATNFKSLDTVSGSVSNTVGIIANVDISTNTLKVKVDNVLQEFNASENIQTIYSISTAENKVTSLNVTASQLTVIEDNNTDSPRPEQSYTNLPTISVRNVRPSPLYSGLSSNISFNVGDNISAQLTDDNTKSNAIFVANVEFISDATEGTLFSSGSTGTAIFVGYKEIDGNTFLRVRAGDGTFAYDTPNSTASSVTAIIDIPDYPKDNAYHEVVVEVRPEFGKATLFIDGVEKSNVTTSDASLEGGRWSGLAAGYFAEAGSAINGETQADWPGNVSGTLDYYDNQVVSDNSVGGTGLTIFAKYLPDGRIVPPKGKGDTGGFLITNPGLNYEVNDTVKVTIPILNDIPAITYELNVEQVSTGDIQDHTFYANVVSDNQTIATSTISSITRSPFIREKNAFIQNPVVRLYSIYYPGEWYPPNNAGNPTQQGEGRAWPVDIPFRFAEIVGDLSSDVTYRVLYDGTEYIPYPVNFSAIETGSDGKINEVTITMSNFDNIISTFVENPFLVGNNTSNSVVALVNNEFVHGIDPRTVNADPSSVGSEGDVAFDTLTRARANGLSYSEDIVNSYGTANASFTYTTTQQVNGTWQEQKQDTRDLLGGVVEIKTTFANFLDYWPEYSSVRFISSNVVEVLSSLPYRVGDNVVPKYGTTEATIERIEENRFLFLSNTLDSNTQLGDPLYIVNNDADPEAYLEDVFKIDNLESLNDSTATFGLISWLQYFRLVIPKRKYYKNTCQWVYKGPECQYPGPNGGLIPGDPDGRSANVNPITAQNEVADSNDLDICGKSLQACTLRNNAVHFGGFPSTGRTIPR